MEEKKIIKGAKLISWQKDFVRKFEELEKDETITVVAHRQCGKSFTLSQILFYVAINRPGSKSIYISPTNDSSRKFFQDMVEVCSGSPLVKKQNESLLELTFINGSSIKFRSAESKLRGNSVRKGGILAVDEANFLSPDIWSVILPFTNVSHANKIIISSPRLKTGNFWDFYKKGMEGEKGYYSLNVSDYDTSMFLSEEQKEDYKNILTPADYQCEVLGQFIDNSQGIFGNYQSVFKTPSDNEPVYCGLDFSSTGSDDTVLSGFNKDGELCMLELFSSIQDPVERAEKIADVINSHKSIKKVVCETNSMGSTYISLLKRLVKKPGIIESFTTTNESKKRIIEQLITSISQKKITLLPNPILDFQFSIFEMKELKKGNYTYGNANVKNGHDDIIMATAFALDGWIKSGNTGTYNLGFKNKRIRFR